MDVVTTILICDGVLSVAIWFLIKAINNHTNTLRNHGTAISALITNQRLHQKALEAAGTTLRTMADIVEEHDGTIKANFNN